MEGRELLRTEGCSRVQNVEVAGWTLSIEARAEAVAVSGAVTPVSPRLSSPLPQRRVWANFGAGSNVCCLQVELATRHVCLTPSVRRHLPLQWRVATSARRARGVSTGGGHWRRRQQQVLVVAAAAVLLKWGSPS